MPKIPLKLPPGLFKNGTRYEARGRWYDSQLIHFLEGTKRPWGGWEQVPGISISSAGRAVRKLLGWMNNAGNAPHLAIGANDKLFVFTQGTQTDITPVGLTAGAVDSAIVVGTYGQGNYGSFNYGEGDPNQATFAECGSWQLDTWGEDLAGVLNADGRIAYWDLSAGGAAQFLSVSWPVAGGTGTMPTGVKALVSTPERFLFALGADGFPRRVRWPEQETVNRWLAGAGNTAGDFDLTTSGTIMCGVRGKNETLLFTDVDVHAAQYIGGVLIYAFKQVGDKCGAISRHSAVFAGGRFAWMSQRGFFTYDGYVRPLECSVSDHVFKNFNRTQRHKVFAIPLTEFGMIIWFYPSAGSLEPDRYVAWNFLENHWAVGYLSRTAGIDRRPLEYPVMVNVTTVYEHERGTAHSGATVPYLESGPIEIGSGDQLVYADELVPDEATLVGQLHGNLRAFIFSALYPTTAAAPDETTNGPYTLSTPTSVRITARQIRVKVEEVLAGDWRFGDLRLNVRPAEGR